MWYQRTQRTTDGALMFRRAMLLRDFGWRAYVFRAFIGAHLTGHRDRVLLAYSVYWSVAYILTPESLALTAMTAGPLLTSMTPTFCQSLGLSTEASTPLTYNSLILLSAVIVTLVFTEIDNTHFTVNVTSFCFSSHPSFSIILWRLTIWLRYNQFEKMQAAFDITARVRMHVSSALSLYFNDRKLPGLVTAFQFKTHHQTTE